MAYIEKICEWGDCDPDMHKRTYDNTLQICADHKAAFTQLVKGHEHIIYVVWNSSAEMYDFYVVVGGHMRMRWFTNRRKWRRNMHKLLGVWQLNIVKVNTHKKLEEFADVLKGKHNVT